jgi:hypothetical protein
LRIEKIDSDRFSAKLNILLSKRASINLYKEISEIAFNNIHEILNFKYKTINFLNIILRKKFKKAYIKGL